MHLRFCAVANKLQKLHQTCIEHTLLPSHAYSLYSYSHVIGLLQHTVRIHYGRTRHKKKYTFSGQENVKADYIIHNIPTSSIGGFITARIHSILFPSFLNLAF